MVFAAVFWIQPYSQLLKMLWRLLEVYLGHGTVFILRDLSRTRRYSAFLFTTPNHMHISYGTMQSF